MFEFILSSSHHLFKKVKRRVTSPKNCIVWHTPWSKINFFCQCHDNYRKIWTFPCKLKKKWFSLRSYQSVSKLSMHFCLVVTNINQLPYAHHGEVASWTLYVCMCRTLEMCEEMCVRLLNMIASRCCFQQRVQIWILLSMSVWDMMGRRLWDLERVNQSSAASP